MGKEEEIDIAKELRSMRAESIRWREDFDKKKKEEDKKRAKENEAAQFFMQEIMVEVGGLKTMVKSHAIDINKYNKIEAFVDNISTFSTWVFKFTLGFIAIGGAIWGAGVFIYNHIRN